jgi:uncharacterized membrane protein/thiol-disulfide isomerase/thioredoxin
MKITFNGEKYMGLSKKILTCLILIIVLLSASGVVHAQNPVVKAILFFSPSCPHCQKVITQDLPPLFEKYQDQLYILGVNTANPDGNALFESVINYYKVPAERLGVPLLLVENQILVGSNEIPQLFPGIVESGLANGGIDWSDAPIIKTFIDAQDLNLTEAPPVTEESGSQEIIPEQPENSSSSIQENFEKIEELSVADRFAQDYPGNTVSVIVLIGMILAIIWVAKNFLKPPATSKKWPAWIAPVLIIVGLGVAIYMAYVEVTQTEAICGPLGHCNTVQQSHFANLFGILPIGVLGVIGYLLIALAWMTARFAPAQWRKAGMFAFFGFILFGTLFSIYLTFLEPFVIGASCSWCLTSAIVMTSLLLYSQGYLFEFRKD